MSHVNIFYDYNTIIFIQYSRQQQAAPSSCLLLKFKHTLTHMDTQSRYIFCLQQNSNSIPRLRAHGKSCLVSLKSPKLHSASPSVEVQGELQSSRLALKFPRGHWLHPVVSLVLFCKHTDRVQWQQWNWSQFNNVCSGTQFSSYPADVTKCGHYC